MRFINCPNCLSSHPDDEYLKSESSIGCSPLNHRKRSRLHSLTKVLFSPARAKFGANKSKEFVCCPSQNRTEKQLDPDFPSAHTKYRLERKHKVKKRDLVKQHQRRSETTGNNLSLDLFYLICKYFQNETTTYIFVIVIHVFINSLNSKL